MKFFNNREVSEWIAIILALTVAYAFFVKMLYYFVNPSAINPESTATWLDILKYIVGGLIGYMSRDVEKLK